MVNKLISIIALPLIMFISCNYKLVVNKRYVVKEEQGYLVFRDGEVSFYPATDTIDVKFLANRKNKEGYKIEFRTDWLDSLSADYSYAYVVKNAKFSLIPVNITYYLGDMWQTDSEKNVIDYKWNNEAFSLHFKEYDYRNILMISVVRETDRKRLNDLHVELPPLHY
jgi:hypothetical protein